MTKKEKNKTENTKTKCTRLNKETAQILENYAKETGRTVSQIIKLAVIDFLRKKRKKIPKSNDFFKGEGNSIQLRFNVYKNSYAYQKLIEEAEKNQRTLQQEIRERLSYTLQINDMKKIDQTDFRSKINTLGRLGNLFKLAIDQNTADEKLLNEIREEIGEFHLNLIKVFFHIAKKDL